MAVIFQIPGWDGNFGWNYNMLGFEPLVSTVFHTFQPHRHQKRLEAPAPCAKHSPILLPIAATDQEGETRFFGVLRNHSLSLVCLGSSSYRINMGGMSMHKVLQSASAWGMFLILLFSAFVVARLQFLDGEFSTQSRDISENTATWVNLSPHSYNLCSRLSHLVRWIKFSDA